MRKLLTSKVLGVALSMTATMAFAQANPQTGATPGVAPRTATGTANSQTPPSSGPAMALVEMNNAEVALAKTASTKAQSVEVKSFANMMVKDHSAALTKLGDVEGVTTTNMKPNAKHQATADRLSKLSGMEFDREYMRVMVADHEEALSFLEKESKATNSYSSTGAGKKTLAKVSEDMIPTVREHLQQAQKIQKNLGVNTQRAFRSGSSGSNNTAR